MSKLVFACCLMLMISCEPEEETLLKLVVTNRLDQEIELRLFKTPGSGITAYESHFIGLNQPYQETIYDDGGADAYPQALHRIFLSGDSIQILFNDTLRITHVNRFNPDPSANVDSTRVYVNNPRSLYNSESFVQAKIGEYNYSGTYVINDADLAYAISVY